MQATIHHQSVIFLTAALALAPFANGREKGERIAAELGLKEGSVVADIGCGKGWLSFRMSKIVGDSGKVFATDISDKYLKIVSDRAQKENIKNIYTVKSDPARTELAPSSGEVI